MHSPRIQMPANQLQKFQREKVRHVGTPAIRGVHYNDVEFASRVPHQPAAAIVDIDADLRILQQAGYLGNALDEAEISRIDFDNSQVVKLGVVSNKRGPRTGGR